jgi:hypothetical protein
MTIGKVAGSQWLLILATLEAEIKIIIQSVPGEIV